MSEPEEYRMPPAQKLMDLYKEANGQPAETLEDLIKWMMSPGGKAATAYNSSAASS